MCEREVELCVKCGGYVIDSWWKGPFKKVSYMQFRLTTVETVKEVERVLGYVAPE